MLFTVSHNNARAHEQGSTLISVLRRALVLLSASLALGACASINTLPQETVERNSTIDPMTGKRVYECIAMEDAASRLWLKTASPTAIAQRGLDRIAQGIREGGLCDLTYAKTRGEPLADLYFTKAYLSLGEFDKANEYLALLLEQDDPRVLRFLAHLYEEGNQGVPQDYRQAFYFYDRLATQYEDTEAMRALGFYLYRGLTGVKNDVAAVHWYHEAAKRGDHDAMQAYAWMVENGIGTQRDSIEANWYRSMAFKASGGK